MGGVDMDRWYLNAWQHRSSGKLTHGSGCWQGRREDIWSGTGNGFGNLRKALAVVEDALRAKDDNAGADFVRTYALIFGIRSGRFFASMLPLATLAKAPGASFVK
jgi:hypothetical protein